MTLSFANQSLTLLPEHAVLLDSTLILADTHFGKSAAFRARGIPIPEGDTSRDTSRILELLDRHHPKRLVIAGDFLHAPESKSAEVIDSLQAFLARIDCETHLVLGNHDRRAGALPTDWPVKIQDTLDLGTLTVVHDPDHAPDSGFAICGHLHPVVRIRDGRNTGFRTPCFWLRPHTLVLPSFGTFTGGAIVHPTEGDRIFAPLRDQVVEIPSVAL